MKAFVAVVLALSAWGAYASPVAMVTDLQGHITIESGDESTPVNILDDLMAGDELDLAGSSRLVVVFLQTGSEYRLAGPARIRMGRENVEVIRGREAQRRSLEVAAAADLTDVAAFQQAAVVMRGDDDGLRLLEPRDVIMERPVCLQWEHFEGAGEYQVILESDGGEVLLDTWTEDTTVDLPDTITLDAGTSYLWTVESRLADGKSVTGTADFRLLDAGERKQIETLRPPAGAPVSEQVVYALLLEGRELTGKARAQWARIAARRPDDPNVTRRAADWSARACP